LLKISSIGFVHHVELNADLDVVEGSPASTLGVRGHNSGGYSNVGEKEEKVRLYTAGIHKRITVFGIIIQRKIILKR
jgi:hypothetical protein